MRTCSKSYMRQMTPVSSAAQLLLVQPLANVAQVNATANHAVFSGDFNLAIPAGAAIFTVASRPPLASHRAPSPSAAKGSVQILGAPHRACPGRSCDADADTHRRNVAARTRSFHTATVDRSPATVPLAPTTASILLQMRSLVADAGTLQGTLSRPCKLSSVDYFINTTQHANSGPQTSPGKRPGYQLENIPDYPGPSAALSQERRLAASAFSSSHGFKGAGCSVILEMNL